MKQDTEIRRTDTKRDEAARQRHIRALEKPTSFAGHRFIIIYCILGMWGGGVVQGKSQLRHQWRGKGCLQSLPTDNYCRTLIFSQLDAIGGAAQLEAESPNYANDWIFLCRDEKYFYVNDAAVLCIISRLSCDAGLAGQGIKFASQFNF